MEWVRRRRRGGRVAEGTATPGRAEVMRVAGCDDGRAERLPRGQRKPRGGEEGRGRGVDFVFVPVCPRTCTQWPRPSSLWSRDRRDAVASTASRRRRRKATEGASRTPGAHGWKGRERRSVPLAEAGCILRLEPRVLVRRLRFGRGSTSGRAPRPWLPSPSPPRALRSICPRHVAFSAEVVGGGACERAACERVSPGAGRLHRLHPTRVQESHACSLPNHASQRAPGGCATGRARAPVRPPRQVAQDLGRPWIRTLRQAVPRTVRRSSPSAPSSRAYPAMRRRRLTICAVCAARQREGGLRGDGSHLVRDSARRARPRAPRVDEPRAVTPDRVGRATPGLGSRTDDQSRVADATHALIARRARRVAKGKG